MVKQFSQAAVTLMTIHHAAVQLVPVKPLHTNTTLQPTYVRRNAHVTDVATTTAVTNLTSSSTRPTKRCTPLNTPHSLTSTTTGITNSTTGGALVTSRPPQTSSIEEVVIE